MKIAKITDEHRAQGFREWPVKFSDGRTETLRVCRPDSARLQEICKLASATARIYEVDAHALRQDLAFMENVKGESVSEIYFVAMGLSSQAEFEAALDSAEVIGAQIIRENLPSFAGNPANN